MHKFDVAGVLIEIISQCDNYDSEIDRTFEFFFSKELRKSDLIVSLKGCEHIYEPEGNLLMNEGIKWLQNPVRSNSTSIFMCNENSDEIIALLSVNDNWTNAEISYKQGDSSSIYTVTGPICEILFRNSLLFHQGLVIHACAIDYEGKGIIFSAPSGAGKTTHANLWKVHKGAKVLNGDRPAVRMINGAPYVYGTPWSGSTPDFINCYAPLTAIVILEQAQENRIRLLTVHEAIPYLMPRCFLPYHDTNLMIKAIQNLEGLLEKTPVYLLSCRPDRESMELVYQCIK